MGLLPFLVKDRLEAGCDEAGRGCLAGPVVAAAVILPSDFEHPLLNDSKKLTAKQRTSLVPIIQHVAVSYAVGLIDNQEIDQINILNASFMAMHKAVAQLHIQPEFLLIDGNRFNPYAGIQHTCIIKGDGKFLSIAAASILAKTYRDDFMANIHQQFPEYNWKKNKGYPTKEHREAIKNNGSCHYHRKSFTLLQPEQLSLNM